MPDIYAGHDSEEEALRLAAQSFFDSLATGLKSRDVQVAIRTGQIADLTKSPQWRLAVKHLAESLTPAQVALVEAGILSGIEEIASKAPRLSPKIGNLARRNGGRRAVALAKELDRTTASGIRRLIKRAAKDYVASQELKTLRTLEKEIRSRVGPTTKQSAKIEKWRKAAIKSGMPESAVRSGVARRTETAKAIRAKAIADRGVIEAVAYGRHQSWVEAVKVGDLPANVQKRWRTQSDAKVRASHRAQAAVGPIPLDEIYAIQGVMYPPSPDRNCRCFESLFFPEDTSSI